MSKLTLNAEPGSHAIEIVREFDAPRDFVFAVWTDPALVPAWWGPEGITTIVDRMEPRKGGSWRYVQRGPGGEEYAFNGVYHDVVAPERVTFTFEFEPMPGHVLLETVRFEELPGGRTRMVDSSVFQSVADRDGMLASGMEGGAAASMDRFAALLDRLRQERG